jgi:hypothetical protein|tara:strand:+ start:1087 stop:1284 length:198 start_codon:yes stop_codon:yes gene_type:complete
MGIFGSIKGAVQNEEMKELSFYDVKGREKFTATKYDIVEKSGRRFAVADAPSGIRAYRILGKALS